MVNKSPAEAERNCMTEKSIPQKHTSGPYLVAMQMKI
jgi:hypothetical protein